MTLGDVSSPLAGGCQCGAVRFSCELPPDNVHVCHCRMCQKAVGGPFAVICPVLKTAFSVTRGEISWFHSSDLGRRGFCRDCGTPMIFDYPEHPDIGVLVGCFDDPSAVKPIVQYGNESRVNWFASLTTLPGEAATYAVDPNGYLPRIQASNRQHPDPYLAAYGMAAFQQGLTICERPERRRCGRHRGEQFRSCDWLCGEASGRELDGVNATSVGQILIP